MIRDNPNLSNQSDVIRRSHVGGADWVVVTVTLAGRVDL